MNVRSYWGGTTQAGATRCARTGVKARTDTAVLREHTAVFRDAEVLRCSMLRSLKSVEACTWRSGTHRTRQRGAPSEIVERRQLRQEGKSLAEPPSRKGSLSPFRPVAITHTLTPRIYFCKCQRGPSFYFSISLAKGVASLSSPWPCYSTAVSLPERPSFC